MSAAGFAWWALRALEHGPSRENPGIYFCNLCIIIASLVFSMLLALCRVAF